MRWGEGFKWMRPASAEDVRLVRPGEDDAGIEWVIPEGVLHDSYEPSPTLFRRFPGVDSPDAAAAFMRTEGPLFSEAAVSAFPGAMIGMHGTYGEKVSAWLDEARIMRDALALYDGIRRSDGDALRDALMFGRTQQIRGTEQKITYSGLELRPDHPLWHLDLGGTVYEQAQTALTAMVTENLARGATPTMTVRPGRAYELDLRPRDLLGAMWLTFARTLLGEFSVISCEVCGEWFAVNAESVNRGRRYCKNACKLKAKRARDKTLASEGGGM